MILYVTCTREEKAKPSKQKSSLFEKSRYKHIKTSYVDLIQTNEQANQPQPHHAISVTKEILRNFDIKRGRKRPYKNEHEKKFTQEKRKRNKLCPVRSLTRTRR